MGEPVARIQSMAHLGTRLDIYGFTAGKFYQLAPMASFVGPRISVPGVVIRKNPSAQVAVIALNMPLEKGDIIITSPSTVLTLEFFIGGRVSVNAGVSIEVLTERSVSSGQLMYRPVRLPGVNLSRGALKQPLEIQTNGGTMGIHG